MTRSRQEAQSGEAGAEGRADLPFRLRLVLGSVLLLAMLAAIPAAAEAQGQFGVWQSPQFGMSLATRSTWTVTEEQSRPRAGRRRDPGQRVSALLVGLLHDTRTPRQMAADLVQSQKEATPGPRRGGVRPRRRPGRC